ncbi:MAG: NAD(P)H-hydrate dehydratase [Anaeroplasmataceae bacterium]
MIVLTEEEMKRIDDYTSKNIKSSYDLMEEAGKEIANIILESYTFDKVVFIAGAGGNGGDAYVAARYLLNSGKDVYLYQASTNFREETKINCDLYKGKFITDLNEILNADIIVDGLIGIGLHNDLNQKYYNLISKINMSNKPIISLDIPSGLSAKNGHSLPICVKCDMCITIEYPKAGLFLADGIDSYKRLKIAKIGLIEPSNTLRIISSDEFKGIFKERLSNSNKGTYKKASIVAGSYKYPGASLIAYNALNAFKMGIGYSYLYVPKSLYKLYALRAPEIIVNPIKSFMGHIKFNKNDLNKLINSSDSISIGMGMGVSKDLYKSIDYLLKNYNKTLIIDADGLNTIAKYGINILNDKKCDLILTPHLKEFSRLSNINISDSDIDIIKCAIDFSTKYNLTLILKSNTTIITSNNEVLINISGNTGLAKGGSGDALSGILTGISAYINEKTITKAALATYILGRSAESCSIDLEEEVMTISDITKYINKTIKEIKNL